MLQQFLHDFGYFALFSARSSKARPSLYSQASWRSVATWISTWWWSLPFWQLRRRPALVLHGAQARPQVAGAQAALAIDGRQGTGTYPQASGYLGIEFPLRLRLAHGDARGDWLVWLSTVALPGPQRYWRGDLGRGTGGGGLSLRRGAGRHARQRQNTSCGCWAPCWCWAFGLWLRRRFKNARIARQACVEAKARLANEPAPVETPKTPTE